MFCNNCGENIPENSNFCPYCGESISNTLSQDFRPAGRDRDPETTNFKVGRTSEEISAEYYERSIDTHIKKVVNQVNNLASNYDNEGFWWRKWSFARGVLFKISIYEGGDIKTVEGYIKDNSDGTISVKCPGFFTSSYYTFALEEVYDIQ